MLANEMLARRAQTENLVRSGRRTWDLVGEVRAYTGILESRSRWPGKLHAARHPRSAARDVAPPASASFTSAANPLALIFTGKWPGGG